MPSLTPSKSILPKRPSMLRSWSSGLGSKLSTATTTPTDSDADDIALEIEQRKKGIDSLYTSTEAYWSYLGKRKPIPFDTSSLPASEDKIEKVLPVEALGLAMSSYSTAFPPHSTYGSCLGLLGEAHLELGALQSTFTKDTSRIFLARIARSKATLESFTAALKKLDAASARLDSAKAKVQKSKKEKRELEEEFRSAQAGYDEAVADVEKREEAVRESEGEDWVCLTKYLEAQMEYVMQARGVLEQVKARWSEAPAALATPMTRPRSSSSVALKTRPAISRRSSAKEAVEGETSRFASQSTLSLSNSDRPSTETDSENPKKNRLRMPSFTNTKGTDSVSSKTTSSFSRTRASSLFGSGETSPDKDKWGFGRKKGAGFVSMDGDAEEGGAPPRLPVRPKEGPGMRFSVDGSDDGMSSESPFSPATGSDGFLAVSRAHDTIHERGESQLSDIHTDHFLTSPPVGLHHTGLSAYSEGGDPFSGGAMSPQGTGGQFDSDKGDAGERQRLTVGGGARADNAGGWRGVMSEMVESGGVKGRLPPPVPGYVKGRSRTPPPPPLPSRNSS